MSRTTSMIQWVAFGALSAALALGTATPVDAQDFPLFVADRSSVDTGEAFGLGVYSVDSTGVVTPRAAVPGSLNSVREDKDGSRRGAIRANMTIEESAEIIMYAYNLGGPKALPSNEIEATNARAAQFAAAGSYSSEQNRT